MPRRKQTINKPTRVSAGRTHRYYTPEEDTIVEYLREKAGWSVGDIARYMGRHENSIRFCLLRLSVYK